MAIYKDPTIDYSRHQGRVNFETIVEGGNVEALMNYYEAFIRRGHDPSDPNDEMYAIMGVSPEYFDHIRHGMEERKLQDTDVFFNKAAKDPNQKTSAPTHGAGHGRGKTQKLGFGPEDDI